LVQALAVVAQKIHEADPVFEGIHKIADDATYPVSVAFVAECHPAHAPSGCPRRNVDQTRTIV
jgi:hypothetical protein